MERLVDTRARPLRSLRLSVTDRCNLRCAYCMPEEEYAWLGRDTLLTFEELHRLARRFQALGVNRLRLTGGEPLLRRELHVLVRLLAGLGLADLALTTNGLLLAEQAQALKAAGLGRLTVSLDTLRPGTFKQLTRRDRLEDVLRGIGAASDVGFGPELKLDTVVLAGVNDDELIDLLAFARERRAEVRFIEYMDVGGATRWSRSQVVSRQQILQTIERANGRAEPLPGRGSEPAERFRLADGTTFGIIASTTAPFCGACDRARLAANGTLLLCLYASQGLDLRTPLRAGVSDEALDGLIRGAWLGRTARGAEDRLALEGLRGPSRALDELRRAPLLEMHTRGG